MSHRIISLLAGRAHVRVKKNLQTKGTHNISIMNPGQLDSMPEAHLIYSWPNLNARTVWQGGCDVNKHLHHSNYSRMPAHYYKLQMQLNKENVTAKVRSRTLC